MVEPVREVIRRWIRGIWTMSVPILKGNGKRIILMAGYQSKLIDLVPIPRFRAWCLCELSSEARNFLT